MNCFLATLSFDVYEASVESVVHSPIKRLASAQRGLQIYDNCKFRVLRKVLKEAQFWLSSSSIHSQIVEK